MKSKAFVVFMVVLTLIGTTAIGAFATYEGLGLQVCKIQGNSMYPLVEEGTYTVSNPSREIERFDVVTLTGPSGDILIKRVIGLPGDTVTVIDGHLFVNGEGYSELYVDIDNRIGFDKLTFRVDVPENEYYVLGDNRDMSADSREFGTITKDNMIGPVFFSKFIEPRE